MQPSGFLAIFASVAMGSAQSIMLEAENATLNQTTVVTSPSGYSGIGAVSMQSAGSITFSATINAPGIYSMTLRVNTSLGAKNQVLYVLIFD